MLDHNMKDLGVFVSIFAEAGYLEHAQEYLNELQERLNTMRGMKKESAAAGILQAMPNEILEELPMVETKEPVLAPDPIFIESLPFDNIPGGALSYDRKTPTGTDNAAPASEPEPEGLVRDDEGKVTHVSTQPGRRGYDANIYENTALKIFCDGVHIEIAIAADTIEGTVWYYEKNEQGRIKTLTMHGKVEIKGL